MINAPALFLHLPFDRSQRFSIPVHIDPDISNGSTQAGDAGISERIGNLSTGIARPATAYKRLRA